MSRPRPEVLEENFRKRFWSQIQITPTCWLWTGDIKNGYGLVCMRRDATKGSRIKRVHRVMWEILHGPIPEGLLIRHTCDVRNCLRPDHLLVGTQKENMQDASQRGRLKGWRKRHDTTKLTREEVDAIRSMYKSGEATQGSIGKAYNVGRTTIGHLVRNETWK